MAVFISAPTDAAYYTVIRRGSARRMGIRAPSTGMSRTSRRDVCKAAFAGAAATQFTGREVSADPGHLNKAASPAAFGLEGQRKADLGDGTFLNPIVAGDHPDPTVLKDGEDYFMTFSSFFSYPGVIIWHSRDLVNWTPVGSAVTKPLGTIWAMDLVKHSG